MVIKINSKNNNASNKLNYHLDSDPKDEVSPMSRINQDYKINNINFQQK